VLVVHRLLIAEKQSPSAIAPRRTASRTLSYHPAMRYGLCLPNFTTLASTEAIVAVAEAADRLGFESVWTTDHVLVDHGGAAADYRTNFDAIETLAWVGARHPGLGLGTSVLVVPQRNAVVLAKELATLDALSSGRLTVGVGVGWNEHEFRNLGAGDRYHVRGAYLEETIALWRHLWSGSSEPFAGRFHPLDDFVFGPLPSQRSSLPIWIGARTDPALQRVGRLADAYHSSATSPEAYAKRIPVIRQAAQAAERPMPALTARVRVSFDEPVEASGARPYAIRGNPEEMRAEIERWADLDVEFLALWFLADTPEAQVAAAERFMKDVAE
jgi:probable F420-dependent oxidoreductase